MPMVKSKCRSCKAPVIWCVTVLGSRIPMDAQPCNDGNMIIREQGDYLQVLHIGKVKDADLAGQPRYKSHFATCPHARQHRRRN